MLPKSKLTIIIIIIIIIIITIDEPISQDISSIDWKLHFNCLNPLTLLLDFLILLTWSGIDSISSATLIKMQSDK